MVDAGLSYLGPNLIKEKFNSKNYGIPPINPSLSKSK